MAQGAETRVRGVDASQADAWEEGKLVLDDEALPAAVSRINRYAHRKWRIDPVLDAVKISGVFDIDDPDAFIDAIASYFDIQVTVTADGTIILGPATVPTQKPDKIAAAR